MLPDTPDHFIPYMEGKFSNLMIDESYFNCLSHFTVLTELKNSHTQWHESYNDVKK